MPDPAISWIIISICIVGHFFFSACETALSCCNKYKIQVEADDGKKTSKLVVKVLDKFDRALTTILVGNNIVAIAISTVSALLFYNFFKEQGLEQYSSLISSIIMTFIVYILGDTLPKTIAKSIPDTISKLFIYPLYIFMIILFPISFIFEKLVLLIEKIFKVEKEDDLTEEQLEDIVEDMANDGNIEEQLGDIIQSALEFDDTSVKDVLTPVKKMFAIDISSIDIETLNEELIENKRSRVPVYENDYDHFIGILNVKTYIKAYLDNPNVDIRKIIQKPYFVTNKIMLDDLFKGFKENKIHIALVKGSNDKVVGMVTMEDVLEELVADISEPHVAKRGK